MTVQAPIAIDARVLVRLPLPLRHEDLDFRLCSVVVGNLPGHRSYRPQQASSYSSTASLPILQEHAIEAESSFCLRASRDERCLRTCSPLCILTRWSSLRLREYIRKYPLCLRMKGRLGGTAVPADNVGTGVLARDWAVVASLCPTYASWGHRQLPREPQ